MQLYLKESGRGKEQWRSKRQHADGSGQQCFSSGETSKEWDLVEEGGPRYKRPVPYANSGQKSSNAYRLPRYSFAGDAIEQ